MRQLHKVEPDFFTSAKSKVPRASNSWSSSHIATIRHGLREYILKNEQNQCCVYCEKQLDANPDKSNIDHFRKQSLFPEYILRYSNLFVSCNTHGRCSNHKDNNVKSRDDYDCIINPIIENPDDYFDYLLTGDIISKTGCKKSEFTIKVFNLNQKSLIESRRKIAKTLGSLNLTLEEILEHMISHNSFIKKVYNKVTPT